MCNKEEIISTRPEWILKGLKTLKSPGKKVNFSAFLGTKVVKLYSPRLKRG